MKINGENLIFCGSRDIWHVMRGEEDCCAMLLSITSYSSAYKLLDNETVLPAMDEDFSDYLQHFDDYEGYEYFCLNNQVVVCADSINGNVIDVCNLDQFLPNLKSAYEYDFANYC